MRDAGLVTLIVVISPGAGGRNVNNVKNEGPPDHALVRDGGSSARDLGRGARPCRRRASRARATTDATTSFGIFSCSKATNEMNFLAQKFARQVMGTNNIDSCNRT